MTKKRSIISGYIRFDFVKPWAVGASLNAVMNHLIVVWSQPSNAIFGKNSGALPHLTFSNQWRVRQ